MKKCEIIFSDLMQVRFPFGTVILREQQRQQTLSQMIQWSQTGYQLSFRLSPIICSNAFRKLTMLYLGYGRQSNELNAIPLTCNKQKTDTSVNNTKGNTCFKDATRNIVKGNLHKKCCLVYMIHRNSGTFQNVHNQYRFTPYRNQNQQNLNFYFCENFRSHMNPVFLHCLQKCEVENKTCFHHIKFVLEIVANVSTSNQTVDTVPTETMLLSSCKYL
jgi:hypothetical protein